MSPQSIILSTTIFFTAVSITNSSAAVVAIATQEGASGNVFSLGSSFGFAELSVPRGYISGTMISGTMTFNNDTFQSLGLSPGTYGIIWPVNAQTDSFTLVVVPEATSTCLVLLSGVSMLLFRQRLKPINQKAEQVEPQQPPLAALSSTSPVA